MGMERLIRIAAWGCVLLLAVLSLLPADEMARTGVDGHIEHAVAYAGTALFMALSYGAAGPAAGLVAYAGVLEFLQRYSPGRTSAFGDFAASSTGVLIGVAAAFAVAALLGLRPRRA